MPENTTNTQPSQLASKNHKLSKAWLITSLCILTLNAGILALGVFAAVAFGATFLGTPVPLFIILTSGTIGLVNLFFAFRSSSKKYFTENFSGLAMTVVVLSGVAVLGVALSILLVANQYRLNKEQQDRNRKYNFSSEVTVQRATDLLNSCAVGEFSYYTDSWSEERSGTTASGQAYKVYGGGPPENLGETSSGILITGLGTGISEKSSEHYRFRMYIEKRNIDTIVPIARQAQKSCNLMDIRGDGRYEK